MQDFMTPPPPPPPQKNHNEKSGKKKKKNISCHGRAAVGVQLQIMLTLPVHLW